ncbi:MAG: ribonuclease HIII [Acidobacteria bacterium]|nr:MAG: ribonuclease HIII [Acidobacteriota bacterium]
MPTLTLKVPPQEKDRLKKELLKMGFEEGFVPNTVWSLRCGGNQALLYPSGSLLLQGAHAQELKEKILSLLSSLDRTQIGCDESGKGDVFGPLVVCCAIVKPEYYKKVLSLNPKDSKNLRDDHLKMLYKALKEFVEHNCLILEPQELNKLHEEFKNLNRILDYAYGQLLGSLFQSYPEAQFFVDAYSKKNPFGDKVVYETRAEERLAVAVASILARGKFLAWLSSHGLPKGSSREVINMAKELLRREPERAKRVLKTFFL